MRDAAVATAIAAAMLSLSAEAGGPGASSTSCATQRTTWAYAAKVESATRSGRDVWGKELLSAPGGPTYEGARRFLTPLLFATQRERRPITPSGVYYLPLSLPTDVRATTAVALHVADGSEIITRRVGGPSLTIYVGDGHVRYGSCISRLVPAALAEGYLPILESAYTDTRGVHYDQESFAGHQPVVRSIISFVRLTVDARHSKSGAVVRLVASSARELVVERGRSTIHVAAGVRAVIYADWLPAPATRQIRVGQRAYDAARSLVAKYWRRRLSLGAQISVPEGHVRNAERALLIAQLIQGWRYSLGNPYEEMSFAEGLDTAQVMAEYGYPDAARAILRVSLDRLPKRFTAWHAGARLLAEAVYFQLTGDLELVDRDAPVLAGVLSRLRSQQLASGRLEPEPLCSDMRTAVDGVPAQVLVWQGLLAMGRVWAATGHRQLAAEARCIATPLESALRSALRASEQRLPDGSLFIPESMSGTIAAYDRLTATRAGSYWNLVMPYAFASGFFTPGGRESAGIIRYLLTHGSRLLGVARADAHIVYGRDEVGDGINPAYGLSVSRLLADNDLPDQLTLSLYGQLAIGMTPGTFVAGEAVSVLPVDAAYFRTAYMAPNLGANSTFLETLRLMLVHERRSPHGAPCGLDLAFATPRAWLREGRTIAVTRAPTSFGAISYSITRHGSRIVIHISIPHPTTVRLRLRLPSGTNVKQVRAGHTHVSFNAASSTIRVPRGRKVSLTATLT